MRQCGAACTWVGIAEQQLRAGEWRAQVFDNVSVVFQQLVKTDARHMSDLGQKVALARLFSSSMRSSTRLML